MRGSRGRALASIGGVAVALAATVGAVAGGGSAARTAGPTNNTPPTVKGQAQEGQSLTGDRGDWSGAQPITFQYVWKRCDKSGGNCSLPKNNNDPKYVLTAGDVGHTIRLTVRASNDAGTTAATSAATDVVTKAPAKPPSSSQAPAISGTPRVGQTLTADPGNWIGQNPISYAYQWQRCDEKGGSCASIIGATQKTYTLKNVDAGDTLRVSVTATDKNGSSPSTSAQTPVIQSGSATPPPPPPAANGCPAGTGVIDVAGLKPPARLLVDRFESDPGVVHRSDRQLIVRFHVSSTCNNRPVQGALVYATAVPFNQFTVPNEQPTDGNGWAELDFRTLAGFPAAPKQQLLALFVRARKQGESLLGGISTRRLVSVKVNLSS